MKNTFRKNYFINFYNEKGNVLFFALAFLALIFFSNIFLSRMVQRDAIILRNLSQRQQARYLAEAGLNHAIADMLKNGFEGRSAFTGSLENGTYSVSYQNIGGREMVVSDGTVEDATVTATAEILAEEERSALNYVTSALNNVLIRLQNQSGRDNQIIGDIHANNDMEIIVQSAAELHMFGSVSTGGEIEFTNNHENMFLNEQLLTEEMIETGADPIVLPEFDLSSYKKAAQESGDYYDHDPGFRGTYAPENGIIYVDADIRLDHEVIIYGGIIADSIDVRPGGNLIQRKSGDRNLIMSKTGDLIFQRGRISMEEGVLYSERHIMTHESRDDIYIGGSIMAKGNLEFFNVQHTFTYEHKLLAPPDIISGGGGEQIIVRSFN